MGYYNDFTDISLNEESFLEKMGYHVGANGTPVKKRHEILLRACILYGYDKVENLFEFYINTGQANEKKQQAVIDYTNDFLWIKFFAKGLFGIYDIPWTSDNKISICLYKGVNKKIFQNFFDELLRNKERKNT